MKEDKYTESQKSAIAWNDGPVIILAGPGSGKTAVLTERIIRIINESENESFRILALTFTNKAAAEMSSRISSQITTQDKRLFVGTFHSFCSEVLRNHGSYVGVNSDFDIFSSNDDLNAIVDDLKNEFLEEHDNDVIDDIKILNAIQYFEKNLCLNEDDMDKIMPNTRYEYEFKWFYFKYIEKLLSLNSVDYDLLILLTYKLFVNFPNIARIYRSMYRYINIDEFQDTNLGQYMLIKSMCGEKNNNLFIVADDDQVIYGWNGASHKRLSTFKDEYNASLIQLFQNFRCPTEVVDLANKLIAHNSSRTTDKRPLESMKVMEDCGQHVFLNNYEEVSAEVNSVSDLIIDLKEKYPTESICVLARNNRLLEEAYKKATERQIKCARSKRKDEFETPYVLLIYDMLKLSNHRNDEKVLGRILTLVNELTEIPIQYEEVILESEISNRDLLKALCCFIIKKLGNEDLEKSIMLNLCEGKNFIKFVDDAFVWMDEHISKIEDIEHREQVESEYNLEKKVWKDFQRNLSYNYDLSEITISTFLQEFSMISKDIEPDEDSVQFLTIHSSKGKEFDNVFLIGMVNDELPSFQSVKKGMTSIEMEEERRNCFVAITRAKKRLYLSYSNTYFGWNKKVSQFLVEMFQ